MWRQQSGGIIPPDFALSFVGNKKNKHLFWLALDERNEGNRWWCRALATVAAMRYVLYRLLICLQPDFSRM
jgi:hypothetical protein